MLLELTSKMSKLWIVHRSPQHRASLARLSGLTEPDVVAGAPNDDEFVAASDPAAILLGLEGDFERELEFAHRNHARLAQTRWGLICAPQDAQEAGRLFRMTNPEILTSPATARTLRAFVAAAVAQRSSASLAERQRRQRIAERFSAWLGGVEVPGLLRALDPSLVDLPLLVRGVPGSGRSLLCHYVEIFRSGRGPVLRLHGRDLREPEYLAHCLRESRENGQPPIRSVWIDEVDTLSVSTQNTLAEWIIHASSPEVVSATGLRWIATASAAGLHDRLEPSLERAFAPLVIQVPALGDHPEALAVFAEEVARDWTRSVGGVTRQFADSALTLLEAYPWSGDRAELEAVLRTSLAASSREMIEDVDLRFPTDPIDSESRPAGEIDPDDAIRALTARPQVPAVPVVEAEEETMEDAEDLESALFEGMQESEAVPTAPLDPEPASIPDESTSLSEISFGLANQPPPESPAMSPVPEPQPNQSWRRLARSLSHEIRNPLVSIRTFAELLPEHFEDETFRARFTELVGKDVEHISDVLTRLSNITESESPETGPVDVSALIEALLDDRRDRIARGRLLVLRELERDAPLAWVEASGLKVALAGLLDRALESLPERGDLFVATRRIERGAGGQARLRILLRHHNPAGVGQSDAALAEFDPTANVLEYVLAESVVEACGGSLTIDATDAQETLILIDLRTPS
jgi:DNA-binding NtrC family response regulator